MPRTKLSSASLRLMSDEDLGQLEANMPGATFGSIRQQLRDIYASIKRMQEGIATEKDYKRVTFFGYGYAGYDDFFGPYEKKNYKKCLDVLKRDISELTRRTNKARMQWIITSGVKSEIARRKRRG